MAAAAAVGARCAAAAADAGADPCDRVADADGASEREGLEMITASLRALGVLSCLVFAGTALPGPSAAKDGADLAALAAPSPPPSFAKPDEAIAALKTALADNDLPATAKLLGLDPAKLGGDADVITDLCQDPRGRRQAAYRAVARPTPDPATRKQAMAAAVSPGRRQGRQMGVRHPGRPRGDASTAASARTSCRRSPRCAPMSMRKTPMRHEDHDGDGVLEYAQKLISSPEGQPTASTGRPTRATATARPATSIRRSSTTRPRATAISATTSAS